jgi:hypothetical protein
MQTTVSRDRLSIASPEFEPIGVLLPSRALR